MRPVVTDRVAWSVGRSVTLVSHAKMAQRIEMPFGLWTRVACTLAPPGEYHWTVHARRRCGLFVKYFDHLFIVTCLFLSLSEFLSDVYCKHKTTPNCKEVTSVVTIASLYNCREWLTDAEIFYSLFCVGCRSILTARYLGRQKRRPSVTNF